ncbi:hypothetical protein KCK34_000942 [Clostridium perfringens]|uniref:hypothetical protein n=1 Tax=Clostridium perfringens TaxID=1502 RepID=UPI001D1E29BC|nr:hypothetical protein [Clostridium perfringens]DAM84977.1 MAG TPA: hypothetical protein [Caudoviricetes sp.]EHK2334514.1 hypothetical protein [Clostridium perfringens]EJT5921701.1 hypothetical protein [Clostridium perfringens]MDK0740527.1 hypothetical protein [Clostridium perfringens]MDK0984604.1 hypothetical protein [Clostridium perfringens]
MNMLKKFIKVTNEILDNSLKDTKSNNSKKTITFDNFEKSKERINKIRNSIQDTKL